MTRTTNPISKAIAALEATPPVKAPSLHAEAQLITQLKDHLLATGEYPENFSADVVRELFGGLRVAEVEARVRATVLHQLEQLNAAITA